MDFDLNEEQKLIRSSAREFFAKACPPTLVRAIASGASGFPVSLWKQMAGLGWLGCIVPEQYGGMGGSFVDLAVLLEQMGAACLPAPYLPQVVSSLILLEAASDEQKRATLPLMSNGSVIVVPALAESGLSYELSPLETRADRQGDDYIVSGRKVFVPAMDVAQRIVLAALVDGQPGRATLFDVPVDSDGISIRRLPTLSGEKQFDVRFDRVRVGRASVLGIEGKAPAYLNPVMQEAAVAQCAEMLGAAEAILEMTARYAQERVQFRHPIAHFQAVQHHCANMLVDLDASRLVTYQAAFSISEGLPFAKQASVAKAWVSEAYRRIDALAHQVHGGIGLIEEHNLTLYTKRSFAAEASFGDADFHRELVAREIGL